MIGCLLVEILRCLGERARVAVDVYKGKGDALQCGSYRGIRLLLYAG